MIRTAPALLALLLVAACAAPTPTPAPTETPIPPTPTPIVTIVPSPTATATPRPTATPTPSATPTPTPTATATPTPIDLDYCLEVALTGDKPYAKKWQTPIRLRVHGSPTPGDIEELHRVIDELVMLTGQQITIVTEGSNVDMHFAPVAEWGTILPPRDDDDTHPRGKVHTYWPGFTVVTATIIISTEESARVRRHVIREELTQALLPSEDSTRYPASIWHDVAGEDPTEFAPVDRACLSFIYRADVFPGMTREELLALADR